MPRKHPQANFRLQTCIAFISTHSFKREVADYLRIPSHTGLARSTNAKRWNAAHTALPHRPGSACFRLSDVPQPAFPCVLQLLYTRIFAGFFPSKAPSWRKCPFGLVVQRLTRTIARYEKIRGSIPRMGKLYCSFWLFVEACRDSVFFGEDEGWKWCRQVVYFAFYIFSTFCRRK
jgi:hypothetical protein